MAQQTINTSNQPNDGQGDPLRTGMNKANSNFTELYAQTATAQATADAAQPALGFTPENVVNKSTDGTLALNSDTKYPSQKAVKTYADTKQTALGFTPENVANKDTDGTLAANSDTKYPSQKAIKTYVDGIVVGLLDDRGSFDASGNVFPSTGGSGTAGAVLKGDIWYISVAGTLGGSAVNIGDSVRALVNTPGQTASNWSILESNIGFVPENVANKTTDGTLAANSDTLYPSEKAVKTYVDAHSSTVAAELSNFDGIAYENFEDYSLGSLSVANKGIGWDNDGTVTGGTIVSRTNFGNGTAPTEKRLELLTGEYIRKLPWGDAWDRLQLYVCFRVNTTTTFTGAGYWGICSGQTNTTNSATTANFIGQKFDYGSAWSFTSGVRADYTGYGFSQQLITRRVNTDSSLGGGTSGSDGRKYAASEGFKSIILLDIRRVTAANDAASVAYNMSIRSTDVNFVDRVQSKSNVWNMLNEGNPSGTAASEGTSIFGTAGPEVAPGANFDQSTGKLDTLNFFWATSAKAWEIASIGVRRVY
jgi:hypothetical protein